MKKVKNEGTFCRGGRLTGTPKVREAKRSSIDRFLVNMIQPGSLHAVCSVIFRVFNIQTKDVFLCSSSFHSNISSQTYVGT